MAGINVQSQFQADIQNYIADELLPLAQRQLVAYQFGDPLTLPEGMGTTYTGTRFQRLPLPYAPLSEGVPPIGETMGIQQVTGVCQQWGDKVEITDQGEITIKHPLFKTGTMLMGLQIKETFERNTFNALMAGSQVNFVNQRGSRGALVSGDVLDTTTVLRTNAALETLGAPQYMGPEETDIKKEADQGGSRASDNPRGMPHYVGICHTLVVADWSQNSTVVLARTYSNLYQLYNYEIGEWSGIRFCKSNMVPTFTGVAAIQGTPGTAGNLATNATYYIIVTASDTTNQYESRIYQVSNSISVTGPNGSVSVVLPSLANFTYSVYIGTSSSPVNLALAPAGGPNQGPLAGQATQLAPGTTVVLTGIGVAQVPPAAPATGLTVYPTFVIGKGAYGIVTLRDIETSFLTSADKSDPLNQLRVMGWKAYWGVLLENNQFFCRIESVSAFSATFG